MEDALCEKIVDRGLDLIISGDAKKIVEKWSNVLDNIDSQPHFANIIESEATPLDGSVCDHCR